MLPFCGSMRPSESGALRCAHLSAKQRHSPPPSRHRTRSLPAPYLIALSAMPQMKVERSLG